VPEPVSVKDARGRSVIRGFRRAVIQTLPVIGASGSGDPVLPARRGRLLEYTPDAERLSRYAAVCGFESRNRLPTTFPHVVAFPLHLDLITDPSYPFRALGLVHVANTITVHQPLHQTDRWDVEVFTHRLRPHRRGRVFTLVTEVRRGGTLVWSEASDMLARGSGDPDAGGTGTDVPSRPPVGPQRWRLAGNLGRQYARVSGDANPIHLSALTAKPFGFRHAIVHGMWELARCVAEIENRLPDTYTVSAEFKRPVFLPGRVTFGAISGDGRLDFGLSSKDGEVTHLLGRVRAALER
jgi:hypothetical protein